MFLSYPFQIVFLHQTSRHVFNTITSFKLDVLDFSYAIYRLRGVEIQICIFKFTGLGEDCNAVNSRCWVFSSLGLLRFFSTGITYKNKEAQKIKCYSHTIK